MLQYWFNKFDFCYRSLSTAPYSPDYNPIEHLWRRVKRQATHNRYFATFEALMSGVEVALQALSARPSEVIALAGTVLDTWAA